MWAWKWNADKKEARCLICMSVIKLEEFTTPDIPHECIKADRENCLNRGKIIETRFCEECSKKSGLKIKIKIFSCTVFGHCTIERTALSGVMSCKPTCNEFVPNIPGNKPTQTRLPIVNIRQ